MLCKQCGYYAVHEHKGRVYELCSTCLINSVIDLFGVPDPPCLTSDEADDAGQKSPNCLPTQHKWKEQYYGYKCEVCQTFVPYGSEPWAPFDV